MKKEYSKPKVDVIEIESESNIAALSLVNGAVGFGKDDGDPDNGNFSLWN